MYIKELINDLQKLYEQEGNIEVVTNNFDSRDDEFLEEFKPPEVIEGHQAESGDEISKIVVLKRSFGNGR